jgi:hypothetical protein
MFFAACLVLSGIVALLGFGYLVELLIGRDATAPGRDDFPADSQWPVDWEQFPD